MNTKVFFKKFFFSLFLLLLSEGTSFTLVLVKKKTFSRIHTCKRRIAEEKKRNRSLWKWPDEIVVKEDLALFCNSHYNAMFHATFHKALDSGLYPSLHLLELFLRQNH